jgi:hypothetical protein
MAGPQDETPKVSRRRFLGRLGAGGAGGVLVTVLPRSTAIAGEVVYKHVWRLSHEGEQACRACRRHARHRYYRLPRFARQDRAHRGCNCDVIGQMVPRWKWRRFFVRRNGTLRARWDTRWNR